MLDWDTTLVDNWDVITRAMNTALTELGREPWSRTQVIESATHSARNRFPAIFGDRWPEAREIFYRIFETYHLSDIRPLPGAPETIRFFQERSIPLAVVSNKRGTSLRAEVDAIGWGNSFATVIGAGDASQDKPSPAPAELALSHLGMQPDIDIWFVGDTEVDVACAQGAGLSSVLVRHDAARAEAAMALGPTHVFADLPGLLEFVQTLDQPICPKSNAK